MPARCSTKCPKGWILLSDSRENGLCAPRASFAHDFCFYTNYYGVSAMWVVKAWKAWFFSLFNFKWKGWLKESIHLELLIWLRWEKWILGLVITWGLLFNEFGIWGVIVYVSKWWVQPVQSLVSTSFQSATSVFILLDQLGYHFLLNLVL